MCRDSVALGQSTLEFLAVLDPTFGTEWELDEYGPDFNHHAVMQAFAVHLGRNQTNYSAGQLRTLGDWLNEAISAGGDIENAVSTCLLEHLRQLRLNRALWPYLSKAAKERTHA